MPKPKRKKSRYIPRPPRPDSGTVATNPPAASALAPAPVRPAPVAANAKQAPKGPPTDQLTYVATELKVIGLLTLVMIALVIAFYFILR